VGTFFLACAILGGAILLIQLVLDMIGFDHFDGGIADGLDMRSVRAVTAGLTFFGIGGLIGTTLGWFLPFALLLAGGLGLASAAGVAWVMRVMYRLESDGSVEIEGALGQLAVVYLRIPGERSGLGKITLQLQGRTVEYQAVSASELPTGTPVVVVDVLGPDLVEVAPPPLLGEM
jgi:hypothetical protein